MFATTIALVLAATAADAADVERRLADCVGEATPACIDQIEPRIQALNGLAVERQARIESAFAARALQSGRPAYAATWFDRAASRLANSEGLDAAAALTGLAERSMALSDYPAAIGFANRAIAMVERAKGSASHELIAPLIVRGDSELRSNTFEAAGATYRRAADLAEAAKSDDGRIAALHGLAEVFTQTERRAEAGPLFARAAALIEASDAPMQSAVGLYRDYSYFRMIEGDRASARDLLVKAAEAARRYQGPRSSEYAGALLDRAELDLRGGDVVAARSGAEEAAAAYAEALERGNGRRGDPYRVLGHIAYMAKDYAGARTQLTKAHSEMAGRPAFSLTRLSTQLELSRSSVLADPADAAGWRLSREVGDIVAGMVERQAVIAGATGAAGRDQRYIFDIALSIAWNHAAAPQGKAAAMPDRGPAAAEIDAAIKQSQALERDGKMADAAEVMKKAVAVAEARSKPDLYRVLDRLNDLLSAFDTGATLANTDRMLAVADAHYGKDDFRTARIRTIQALFAGLMSGDNARMLRDMPPGIAEMNRLARTPTEREETGTAAGLLAKRLVVSGRNVEARGIITDAVALLDRGEVVSTNAAITYGTSADLLTGWGEYALAERHGERALALYEKFLGPNAAEVAMMLGTLSRLRMLTGRSAEAEPLLRRALAVADATTPPQMSVVVRTLEDLGGYYVDRGRPELAEPLFARAATTAEALPKGSDLAEGVLTSLTRHYLALGRIDDARRTNAAVISRAEARDARSEKAGNAYLQAAQIALAAGDLPAARTEAGKAKALYATILAAGDPRRGDALAIEAEIAERAQDRPGAAKLWREASAAMAPRGYPNASREAAAIRSASATLGAGERADWTAARTAGDAMTRRLAALAVLPSSPRGTGGMERRLYDRMLDVAWAAK